MSDRYIVVIRDAEGDPYCYGPLSEDEASDLAELHGQQYGCEIVRLEPPHKARRHTPGQ